MPQRIHAGAEAVDNAVAAEGFHIGEIRYEGPFPIDWAVGYDYLCHEIKK